MKSEYGIPDDEEPEKNADVCNRNFDKCALPQEECEAELKTCMD